MAPGVFRTANVKHTDAKTKICHKNRYLLWRPEYFVLQTLNTQNTISTTEYACRYDVRCCNMTLSSNNALKGFSSFLYSFSD